MELDEPRLLHAIRRGWSIRFARQPSDAYWTVSYSRGPVYEHAEGTTLVAAVTRACNGIEQLERDPQRHYGLSVGPPPPPFVNALGGTEPLDAGDAAGQALIRRQRRQAGLDPDR